MTFETATDRDEPQELIKHFEMHTQHSLIIIHHMYYIIIQFMNNIRCRCFYFRSLIYAYLLRCARTYWTAVDSVLQIYTFIINNLFFNAPCQNQIHCSFVFYFFLGKGINLYIYKKNKMNNLSSFFIRVYARRVYLYIYDRRKVEIMLKYIGSCERL